MCLVLKLTWSNFIFIINFTWGQVFMKLKLVAFVFGLTLSLAAFLPLAKASAWYGGGYGGIYNNPYYGGMYSPYYGGIGSIYGGIGSIYGGIGSVYGGLGYNPYYGMYGW